MKRISVILMCLGLLAAVGILTCRKGPAAVQTGADRLLRKHVDLIRGKRVGLIVNHSALLSDGTHLADILHRDRRLTLAALFSPEHGIRGDAPDRKGIRDTFDEKTGVGIFSLFGDVTKPTPEMLENIDVLIFDIQEVGARFYTFISTMFLTMEAAAEKGILYLVLDRPNPITGTAVEGPIRDENQKSFVGWAPMPITHGLTVGELALMANGEGWLSGGIRADLTVVRMNGWERRHWYDETGLTWIKPSPSMLTLQTAVVYPGTCLIEGTNVSEGRGSGKPFEYIGAPWIDGEALAAELEGLGLPGVRFRPKTFVPTEIEKVTTDPKYEGELCRGVYLEVIDRNSFEPVRTGVALVRTLASMFPGDFLFRDARFDRLAGTDRVRIMILEGRTLEEILGSWAEEVLAFRKRRAVYLLYE